MTGLSAPPRASMGGWAGPRAGLNGCGKFPLTGIRAPDRRTRNKSLYRLSLMYKYERYLPREITLHVAEIVNTEPLQHYTQESRFVSGI